MNIKKGDTVEILTGKDKGKRGEILRVLPAANRVVVQGLNLRRKHQKAQPMSTGRQTAPEIVVFEGSLNASNVMLVCPKCKERTRVGRQRSEDGRASRVCKQCAAAIDG